MGERERRNKYIFISRPGLSKSALKGPLSFRVTVKRAMTQKRLRITGLQKIKEIENVIQK